MTAASRGERSVFPDEAPHRIGIAALGFSLSSFLALSYFLCFLLGLLSPDPVLAAWQKLLPGMVAATPWWGLLEGLVLSVVCGWYVALVFGTIYNYFAAKFP